MAYNNLGNVCRALGNRDAAAEYYRQATRIQPDYAEAHGNLGAVLQEQGKLDGALLCYEQALRLQPTFPDAHNNLATAYLGQGKLQEALSHYDQAVQLKPDYVEAHWNRSCLRLLLGDFEGGWPEYEWRLRQAHVPQRSFQQPLWDGSLLNGKTILLYAEQGFGDTFQFIRYAALVKQRGGNVIVECPSALERVLGGVPGIDEIKTHDPGASAEGSAFGYRFDFQAPLLSLPGILQTTIDTIPAAVPYLHPRAELELQWRRELRKRRPSDFLVGIAWQGRLTYGFDKKRSIDLTHFVRLAQVAGVHLISLQKGPGTEQLTRMKTEGGRKKQEVLPCSVSSFRLHPSSFVLDEASGPFMDTCAIMQNLDLVISSDTAVPHLAGALGVPVWVALPAVPDWRWLLEREDSPWYPNMRLFRQTRQGCWDDVFERMAGELERLVRNK
jgi:hypothetical protein